MIVRAVLVLLALSSPGLARAEGPRVLMVNAEPELVRAARSSLSAAVEQDAALRSLTQFDAQAVRARELAYGVGADIVVWATADRAGQLHVYDARAGRLLGTRSVSRPVSPATAAALVLSIKVLLQTAPVAADGGELPASEAAARASEESRLPAPSQPSAAPPGPQPRAAPRALRDEAGRRPVTGSLLDLTLHTAMAEVERFPVAALGFGATAWPRTGALGAALSARVALPVVVDGPALQARLLDVVLAADLALRFPRRTGLRLAVGAGPRMHFTRLQGALGDARLRVDTRRLVPGLGATLQVGWQLAGPAFIDLWATVDWLLIAQRYLVDDVRVHESGRRRAALGLGLGISLD